MSVEPATSGRAAQALRGRRPGAGVALTIALAVIVIWGVTSTPYFLVATNIASLLLNLVELGMVALALTPVIIAGEIDVSVEGMVSLSAAVSGMLFEHHVSALIVLVAVLLVGFLGGLLNALLVTKVKLPSLVVTLGTMALFNGLALVTLGQSVVGQFPSGLVAFINSNFLGLVIPTITVMFVILGLVQAAVVHRSVPGRRLFFIGKNANAAVHTGIRTARYKAATFVYAGMLSALAGLTLVLQYSSARGDSGAGLLLPALTAVVLGGVDVRGGRGNVLAVVAAVFVTATILNIQTLLGWGPQVGQITVGLFLVLSVAGRPLLARAAGGLTGARPRRPPQDITLGTVPSADKPDAPPRLSV